MDRKKEIDRLQKKLDKTRKENQQMWLTYGSELCVGEMIRKEEEIKNKISALTDQLNEEDR